jgi:hypothetical protein
MLLDLQEKQNIKAKMTETVGKCILIQRRMRAQFATKFSKIEILESFWERLLCKLDQKSKVLND